MDINVSRLLCFGIEVCEFGIKYIIWKGIYEVDIVDILN